MIEWRGRLAHVGDDARGRGAHATIALFGYNRGMVRPERIVLGGGSRCIELAGESPVVVSAEAPRSRPRTREEILAAEWGVKSPQRVIRRAGGRRVRRPSIKRTLQPREISNRKVVPAEPLMSRRRQQTAREIGAAQDGRGVERRACGDSSMRNRRDPSRRPRRAVPCRTSGKGGSDKPKVKQDRAGRESEGFIVPVTFRTNRDRGKEPCFGHGRDWR